MTITSEPITVLTKLWIAKCPFLLTAFFNRPISKKRDSLLVWGDNEKFYSFLLYFHYFLDVLVVSETRIAPIRPARAANILTRIPLRAYTASVRREMMAGEDYALGHSTHTLCFYTSTQPSLFSAHPLPLSPSSLKLRWDFSKDTNGTENSPPF